MLFIILQQASTQVAINDISFRTMDVVYIILGATSMIGGYFVMRYKVEKVNDRVTSLEKELAGANERFESLESKIGSKLEEVGKGVHELALGFANFKTEMMKFVMDNKHH